MKKILLYLAIIFLVTTSAFLLIMYNSQITGEVILDEFSYTRAICNKSNYCEDYIVECKNQEVSSLTPTGNAVWHEPSWKDPRDKEYLNKSNYCKI